MVTVLETVDMITKQVEEEVRHSMQIHKGMASFHEAKAVIEEEFDEFWELVKINPKKLSLAEQDNRRSEMRKELIQIAAMCVRTISDLGL